MVFVAFNFAKFAVFDVKFYAAASWMAARCRPSAATSNGIAVFFVN